MFMRTSLVLLVLMLLPAGTSSQETGLRKAQLVRRYESGCGYSCNQELAIDLGGIYGNRPDDLMAVRFCSRLPLPRAYAIAASRPSYVNEILMGSYHYTPDRILFLRSDGCIGRDPSVVPTEYWIVPKGADLPPSVESFKLCQIKHNTLGDDEYLSGDPNYKVELPRMARELRANPKAVGFVVGYYIKRPSRGLRGRMLESEKLLARSGLPRSRYMVHMMRWTGEYSIDPPEPEPKYPTVFTVALREGCQAEAAR
jgi:hypothetical protein